MSSAILAVSNCSFPSQSLHTNRKGHRCFQTRYRLFVARKSTSYLILKSGKYFFYFIIRDFGLGLTPARLWLVRMDIFFCGCIHEFDGGARMASSIYNMGSVAFSLNNMYTGRTWWLRENFDGVICSAPPGWDCQPIIPGYRKDLTSTSYREW